MERPSTKQSKGATKKEKEWIIWVKQQPCSYCGNPGPNRYDHCAGSSAKIKVEFETVLIGHRFGLSECLECSRLTHLEKRDRFGPHWILWKELESNYEEQTPDNIKQGIEEYGKKYGR